MREERRPLCQEHAAHRESDVAWNSISSKYSRFDVQTVVWKTWAAARREAWSEQDLRADNEAEQAVFHQGAPRGSGAPERRGNSEAEVATMSAMREEAARGTSAADKMGQAGWRANSRFQEGWRSSATANEGGRSSTTGARPPGNVHKNETRAWSEPSDSAKETEGWDRRPEESAKALERTRSRTESRCPDDPRQVGTHGHVARVRPADSNQSSRVAAQEEVVA
jgi:hypothetical protein